MYREIASECSCNFQDCFTLHGIKLQKTIEGKGNNVSKTHKILLQALLKRPVFDIGYYLADKLLDLGYIW